MKGLAKFLSALFHPLLIAFYSVLIYINIKPFSRIYSAWDKTVILLIVLLFTLIVPLEIFWIGYKNGQISDSNVSKKEQRTVIYIVCLLSYTICLLSVKRFLFMYFFMYLFLCPVLSIIFLMIINIWWKISAHACGMGILCGVVFSSAVFMHATPVLLFPAVILIAGAVMTARLYLQAHTLSQVVAGFFVGLMFSLLPLILMNNE
ncbi:MAG: phosphatase PAP2 family protein [Prevotellaceae bacterium]|jgi:hypothetical protein|nr:phosphatase PAP2 family protein [Prevotellaceae bacterium]